MKIRRQIVACMMAAGMVVTGTQEYSPLASVFAAETDKTTYEDVKVGTVLTLESGAKSTDKVEWAYGIEGGEAYIDSQWCEFADSDENATTRTLKITGVKEYQPFSGSGYITITASVDDEVIHTWKISTVAGGEVTTIDITKSNEVVTGNEYSLIEGNQLRLSCQVEPEGSKVTWNSSNEKVATVKGGVITGVSEGNATISVSAENGLKAEVKVQVVAEKVSGDYTYIVNEKDTVSITKYNGSAVNINIPDTIAGIKVTAIEEQAFAGNETMETVLLPDSVVSIGNYAFAGASVLKSVTIPATVTSIGNGIFDRGNQGIVLLCKKGSYAESYAQENKLTYVSSEDGNAKLPVISKETAELTVGGTMEIAVENTDTVNWTWLGTGDRDEIFGAVGLSSVLNNKITVTAEEAGTVTLTANINGYKQTCIIEITNPSSKTTGKIVETDPNCSGYYLKPCSPIVLEVGDVKLVGVKLTEEDDTTDGKEFTWESSDNSIATVSAEGTVTAKKAGECVIKAILSNGMTASCNVVVSSGNKETTESTNTPEETKAPGKTGTPSKTNTPLETKAPDKTGTPSKTSVPEETKIPGKTETPDATQRPITSNGANTTNVPSTTQTPIPTVTPTSEMDFSKIALSADEITVFANGTKGKTKTVSIKGIETADVQKTTITWKSEDERVATVTKTDDLTGEITAVKKGTTNIIVTVVNGSFTKNYIVAVNVKNPSIKVTGKKIVKESKKITLKATTYGLKGKVTWKVNKKKLATISQKGVLKAKKAGKVKVTAICGKYKKTFTVTIK